MPSGPEYQRLQRGQRIPAALLNAHSEALEAVQYASLPLGGVAGGGAGGMDAGGNLVTPPAVPVSFLAKITAKDASTPPKYSWSAWLDPDTAGAQAYDPDATAGGPGSPADFFPAYPYDPLANVPAGSVVLLEPSTWGECFRFFWPPDPSTVSTATTFSSLVTFLAGLTVSGGAVTVSGTTTLSWTSTGAQTFTAGGTVYGQTAAPGTRPAGYLVLPWITAGQVPTYTGQPGEVVCNGKELFQYDGSVWNVYAPFATATLTAFAIPYVNTSGRLAQLPVGTNGQVLTVVAGAPAWVTPTTPTLTGTGAANSVAVWTGTTSLGTGTLTDDGTTATATKRLALGYNAVTLAADVNNWAPGDGCFFSVSCTKGSPAAVTGLSPAPAAARLVLLHAVATASNALLLKNNSGLSTYPILTGTGADLTLADGQAALLGFHQGRTAWVVLAVWGAVPAAFLPALGAAGTGHAAGLAPDPGATAHANQPYYLGDDAAYHVLAGGRVGDASVDTDETTTSASLVELTTTQRVTFTLDAAGDVWCLAVATASDNVAAAIASVGVDMDGTATSSSQTLDTATGQYPAVFLKKYTGLSAASHTAKMVFAANAGTCHFKDRRLYVWRAA